MKLRYLLLTLLPLGLFGQEFYFSTEPFEIGVPPNKEKCATKFSDNESLFGLLYFEGSLEDLSEENDEIKTWIDSTWKPYQVLRKNIYVTYSQGFLENPKCFPDVYIIEQDGKCYGKINLIPTIDNFAYCGSMTGCKGMRDIHSKLQNPIKKTFDLKFRVKEKGDILSSIEIKKSGEMDSKKMNSLYSKCFDAENEFDQIDDDRGRGDEYERMNNKKITWVNFLNCNETNVFNYTSTSGIITPDFIKKEFSANNIFKIYACSNNDEWELVKNRYGNIVRKISQPYLIFIDAKNPMGYHYKVYYWCRELQEDGVTYGEPYLCNGNKRASGVILKSLCDDLP